MEERYGQRDEEPHSQNVGITDEEATTTGWHINNSIRAKVTLENEERNTDARAR